MEGNPGLLPESTQGDRLITNETHQLEHGKEPVAQRIKGICFEDLVFHIEKGDVLDDYLHPNQKKYSGQRIMVICFDDYAYLVPYVENEEEPFLKTIIPSRKATEKYLGEDHESKTVK